MDPASPATTIDLIRHGQPLGGDRFRGQLDDPLSEAGWQDDTGPDLASTCALFCAVISILLADSLTRMLQLSQ